jgi:hypothetical protein|tara:strand:+ start:16035 stop:16364 length:330 start_codon:yes stop_codon:yes gene_type:complete
MMHEHKLPVSIQYNLPVMDRHFWKAVIGLTIAVIVMGAVSACSHSPVVDPKASANPGNIIEDKMECEYLMAEASMWQKTNFMLATCLEGRGHSVINYHGYGRKKGIFMP